MDKMIKHSKAGLLPASILDSVRLWLKAQIAHIPANSVYIWTRQSFLKKGLVFYSLAALGSFALALPVLYGVIHLFNQIEPLATRAMSFIGIGLFFALCALFTQKIWAKRICKGKGGKCS
jgi:hypothetical protein